MRERKKYDKYNKSVSLKKKKTNKNKTKENNN